MEKMDAHTSLDCFSPLEKLPTELAWQVIDHAPEAALEMRMTSQRLKKQVDDYTRATRTTLVKKLSFADVRLPGSKKKPGYLGVMFDVCKPKSGLFYLRLFLLGLQDFKTEMRRLQNIKEEEPLFYNRNFFCMDFDIDDASFHKDAAILREYLGKRIGRIIFTSVTGDKRHEECAALLNGIQLGQLKYHVADVLVDEDVKHLCSFIRAFRIEELSITVSYLNTSTDPVNVLRQLASQLKSLFIYQTPNTNKDMIPSKYLFGANDVDWAEVILELFDGKLDKLCIKNPSYPEYLSSKGADKLKEEIPELQKPVWFMGTCNKYDKLDHYVFNYEMKVNPAPAPPAHGNQNAQEAAKQFLQIRHETRKNEPSMDPYLVEDDIAETMKAR